MQELNWKFYLENREGPNSWCKTLLVGVLVYYQLCPFSFRIILRIIIYIYNCRVLTFELLLLYSTWSRSLSSSGNEGSSHVSHSICTLDSDSDIFSSVSYWHFDISWKDYNYKTKRQINSRQNVTILCMFIYDVMFHRSVKDHAILVVRFLNILF